MALEASGTLRVLYSFPHAIGAPGIGTTAYQQVVGLAALGVNVELWCTSLARSLPRQVDVHTTLSWRGRRVPHRALGVERAYAWHDRSTARRLDRGDPLPDVVHTWPAGCLATLAAARHRTALGCREVPSVHTAKAYSLAEAAGEEIGVELPEEHSQRRDPRRLDRELREFDAAEVLLVPSAVVEASFLERGVPASRLARHRYGCDLDRFWPAERSLDTERPLVACFIGRGEPTKGLHFGLQAWVEAGLPSTSGRFLIAGAVLPAYRDRIAALLDQAGAEELGFVDDIPDLLRKADVLVLPTVSEGSALVTFEAMASGCVPLVSDAAGAPCEHDVDGLVHQVGDVNALAGHLRRIDTDRAVLGRLRAAALGGRDDLGWDAAARSLLAAYRTALAAR